MSLRNSATVKAKYDLVCDAIDKIVMGGQSVTIEGNTITRANLKDLERMRDNLEEEYIQLTEGGSRQQRLGFNYRR